jgi:CRP/FNR family cyclic AMP-dependent transcriptional regulator
MVFAQNFQMINYASLKFFKGFPNEEIGRIVRLMIPVTYAEGETVLKEGEMSNVLMLIIKGQAKVMKQIDEKNFKLLSILEVGDIFGEMSFFDTAPHDATVIAHNDISVLALSKKDFETFIDSYPKFGNKILSRIIQVSSERIRNLNEEVKQLGSWCISLRSAKK